MSAGLQAERATLSGVVPAVPRSITHVWPALPGAGVTPVLLAAQLGIEHQSIRPSSRGRHFAERFAAAGFETTAVVGGAALAEIGGLERGFASYSGGLDDAMALAAGRMRTKLLGAREALDGGVRRGVLGDARVAAPITRALDGHGTSILAGAAGGRGEGACVREEAAR